MPNVEPDKIKEYVFKNGKEYKVPARFPADIMRGRTGDCFDTAMLNAAYHPHYRYVEGYAQHPTFKGIWILHAWVTDGEHVFDPTWHVRAGGLSFPVKVRYVGIEIDMKKLIKEFVGKTEYKAILANSWRDIEAARKVLPGLPYGHASDLIVKND